MKLFLLALKNLRRNTVRAALTAFAMILLAAVFCMVATVLRALNAFTAEKTRDIKLIVTERYRIPSSFDTSYVEQMIRPGTTLNESLSRIPGFDADKHNVWQFVGFTLDAEMRNKELQFLCIATLPDKLLMMTDSLEGVDPHVLDLVRMPPKTGLPNTGLVMGQTRLERLNKRVGDVLKAKSFSHRTGDALRLPIEMEFEIVGVIPSRSQWADAAFMDYAYLKRVLQDKKSPAEGKVDLAWLMVADQTAAEQVSITIEKHIRDLKCETLSKAFGRWFAPLKDFFWGIKFVIAPAITIVMIVIIANAIGITVRERTREMAILKVLGFRKGQILTLVLSEGLFIGFIAGITGGGVTQWVVDLCGGIRMSEGNPFFVSRQAWWWGPTLGVFTAFLGGILPAWNACRVKVSEVFARVA